jgi:hypothetical protein
MNYQQAEDLLTKAAQRIDELSAENEQLRSSRNDEDLNKNATIDELNLVKLAMQMVENYQVEPFETYEGMIKTAYAFANNDSVAADLFQKEAAAKRVKAPSLGKSARREDVPVVGSVTSGPSKAENKFINSVMSLATDY